MAEKYEIVYVLRNEAMPNLIKIGITQRKDLQTRMSELYSTVYHFLSSVYGLERLKTVKELKILFIMLLDIIVLTLKENFLILNRIK